MFSSFADFDIAIRNIVFGKADPDMLFSFDTDLVEDVSGNDAGELFKQNEDFWIFHYDVRRVRRAGPGHFSPRRAWVSLSISLATKEVGNSLQMLQALERVTPWFEGQTVSGIRFREFSPLPSYPLRGFEVHEGEINCEFELKAIKG